MTKESKWGWLAWAAFLATIIVSGTTNYSFRNTLLFVILLPVLCLLLLLLLSLLQKIQDKSLD